MKRKLKPHQRSGEKALRASKAIQQTPRAPVKAPKMEIRSAAVYTVGQLAEILQVTDKTARAILNRGEIPARKIGRAWRILGENIKAYMTDFRPLVRVGIDRAACYDDDGAVICQCQNDDTYIGSPVKKCKYGHAEDGYRMGVADA